MLETGDEGPHPAGLGGSLDQPVMDVDLKQLLVGDADLDRHGPGAVLLVPGLKDGHVLRPSHSAGPGDKVDEKPTLKYDNSFCPSTSTKRFKYTAMK